MKTKPGQMNGDAIALKDRLMDLAQKYVIILVFIVSILVFGLINPKFISPFNILNIIWQNSYLVVAALGMTVLLISGGVDLSAGYEISIGGVVAAACLMWWNLPVWVAVIVAIAVVTVLSLINGILAIKLKINSLMVTLATMTIYSGVSNIFTGQKAIFNLPDSFKYIGQGSLFGVIPIPFIIMGLLIIMASFILSKTYFGRYIYAIGGNPEAARLAGINLKLVKLGIFALGGFFFGVSAVLLVARTGSANASMASGSEFTVLTASVLGGVAIQGGEGKIWSVVVAVFILGILANGMQLIGLNTYAQYIAKGIILAAAMGFDTYQKNRKARVL